jgi:hypothetical protein
VPVFWRIWQFSDRFLGYCLHDICGRAVFILQNIEDAEFVIGAPTEIERPHAWKTEYVGKLKDGKTRGFWSLILATPYRGRAIPYGMVT